MRLKQLRNAGAIFARYGRGIGCDACQSVLASVLLSEVFTQPNWKTRQAPRQEDHENGLYHERYARFDQMNPMGVDVPLATFVDRVHARYQGLPILRRIDLSASEEILAGAAVSFSDLRLVSTANRYKLFVGGSVEPNPSPSRLLACLPNEAAMLRIADRILAYFQVTSGPNQRFADWFRTLEGGVDHLREIVHADKLEVCGELDELFVQMQRQVSAACFQSETDVPPNGLSPLNVPESMIV